MTSHYAEREGERPLGSQRHLKNKQALVEELDNSLPFQGKDSGFEPRSGYSPVAIFLFAKNKWMNKMDIDTTTLKNLLEQWKQGIIPQDTNLQKLMDFFQLMVTYLEHTKDCNVLLVRMRDNIYVAKRMMDARIANEKMLQYKKVLSKITC